MVSWRIRVSAKMIPCFSKYVYVCVGIQLGERIMSEVLLDYSCAFGHLVWNAYRMELSTKWRKSAACSIMEKFHAQTTSVRLVRVVNRKNNAYQLVVSGCSQGAPEMDATGRPLVNILVLCSRVDKMPSVSVTDWANNCIDGEGAETIISPPYVFIPLVKSMLRTDFQVAAQNCWKNKGGAFTGEIRFYS